MNQEPNKWLVRAQRQRRSEWINRQIWWAGTISAAALGFLAAPFIH